MKKTRVAALLLALIAIAWLPGCGNKGDLVHPDKTPATASP